MKNLVWLCILFSANLYAKSINLNEALLKKLVSNNPPGVQQIKAMSEQSSLNHKMIYDKMGLSFNAQGAYINKDEQPLHAYDTIITPIRNLKAGFIKPTELGMQLSAHAYTEQTSSPFMKDQTSSGLLFGVSIDLYKDFLGSSTRANLQSTKHLEAMAKIESTIGIKAYTLNLRKIYWALISNNEKIILSKMLLTNSETQAKNARKRLKDSVADKGEVAKFESQVAYRKANIIYFEYLKEQYIKSLKELLPELSENEIDLGSYNLDKSVTDVVSCTQLIASKTNPPGEYTLLDEVIDLLNQSYENQKIVTSKYSDIDIGLVSNIKTVGKSNSFSQSYENHSDNRRANLEMALNVTIPLSSRKSETRDTKEALEKLQHRSRYDDLSGKIKTYHKQINQQITLLQMVFQNQKINSQKLEISLKTTKTKYNQARIDVYNLINDQDAYLQSQLAEIDTKLAVVTTLLDYLTVFTELPCAFNRI